MTLLRQLAEAGTTVLMVEQNVRTALKYADRAKVPVAILLGSREQEAGVVKIKDLRETAAVKEQDVPRADVVAAVARLVS